MNNYLAQIAIFIFVLLTSLFYGFVVQINPIPPFNILIWAGFCFVIFKIYNSNDGPFDGLGKTMNFITLAIGIYMIYLVRSVHFVAYFNQIHLTGSTSLIPQGFQEAMLTALFNPGAFFQKLLFLLSWDSLSITLGGNTSLSFGIVITNIFRTIEIIGIFSASLIFNKLTSIWALKSK